MKILSKLHIVFYISLLVYICLIPNHSTDSNLVKVLFTLTSLGLFIGITAVLSVVTFNKAFSTEKKYAYAIVFLLLLNVVLYLPLGHSLYEKTDSLVLLISMMVAFFIITNILMYKMKDSLLKKDFDYSGELRQFLRMGDSLKGTPLMKVVNRLDYFFYAYCIAVFIAEDLFLFTAVVMIILLLSVKPLKELTNEFSKSDLISKKETVFAVSAYYGCYAISIIWFWFFPNLSALLIGSVSLLTIKNYIHRVAKENYHHSA
ncbi:hypothetical protein NQ095_18715 [Rossellomorea sp. SC111]|uniref:hypothetical protein n=1 Tax=Rossellomorea sp. SC111 TaxID=2968985 RepID=UPI00215AE33F|nr:hypothetical protein [Rossellomorea sp. SC111]MCR8850454.1 hypothetical protein [Rossellomorea sp. SC111]